MHELRIRIPDYAAIRVVDATGIRTDSAVVAFDYGEDPEGFLAVARSGGTLHPTEVMRFEDIEVLAGGDWYVSVRASPLDYIGPLGGAGLNLRDIEVHRGVASGLTPADGFFSQLDATWKLDEASFWIAQGIGGTGGWRSLGFNGRDYVVRVNGDEDPGEYHTVVTYLLASP